MSKCKRCGAEIVWVKTASGKSMPCDPELVLLLPGEGNDTVIANGGSVFKGEIVSGIYDSDDSRVVYGRTPHWATCPYADEFRNRKAGE